MIVIPESFKKLIEDMIMKAHQKSSKKPLTESEINLPSTTRVFYQSSRFDSIGIGYPKQTKEVKVLSDLEYNRLFEKLPVKEILDQEELRELRDFKRKIMEARSLLND